MARYRTKDETDLRWNRIRRRLTRELDTEIANAREVLLNDVLSGAWTDYKRSLASGKSAEVEGKYTELVRGIVTDIVPEARQVLEGAEDAASVD